MASSSNSTNPLPKQTSVIGSPKITKPRPIYTYQYRSDAKSISVRDRVRVARAARLAASSEHRFPIAAVLYSGGRPVGQAKNYYASGPMVLPDRFSVHAEIALFKRLKGKEYKGSTLYVARLNKDQQTCLAMPCAYCLTNAIDTGVTRVVFTTVDGIDAFKVSDIYGYTTPIVKDEIVYE